MRRILVLCAVACLSRSGWLAAQQTGGSEPSTAQATLEETRLKMGKWIEMQQLISKERKEWQQGREILQGRLELARQEVAGLQGKIKEAESQATDAESKRAEVLAEIATLQAATVQITEALGRLEGEVRRLFRVAPEPARVRLQQLYDRIPEDPATAKSGLGERFQNVIGILDGLNKANNEIGVSYEVHSLADGKPSEVRALYVGLAQAYYLSARGEAGIGRPGVDAWEWEPAQHIAPDLMVALDILQGKHSPAFVPLPVTLR